MQWGDGESKVRWGSVGYEGQEGNLRGGQHCYWGTRRVTRGEAWAAGKHRGQVKH